MNPSPLLGQRAIVLGASIAGLAAARVLAERFAEVVLVERDRLPAGPQPRKGTPHAVHPHGLLARGREVLEQLFPGLTGSLVERGALRGDLQRDVAFDANGRRFADAPCGDQALAVSRLALESEVRKRVLALPHLRLEEGSDVAGLVFDSFDSGRRRVTGVRLAGPQGGAPRELRADLVVDCTGRGSQLPGWLAQAGLAQPAEERVGISMVYVSAYFRREGPMAWGDGIAKLALICAATPALPRPAALIAQEPGDDGVPRWVLGVGGYRGDHPTFSEAGMRERALAIGSPELVRLTHEGERLGELMRYHFAYSQRRRYERLSGFPAGLLAMGDAIASFNPIYGQGMTVAACEALVLRDALAGGLQGLHRRFFAGAARVVDVPWQLAVGSDLALPVVQGPRPLPVRLVNAYIARLYRVAPHDAMVAHAFLQVVHLKAAPASLFAPAVLWRVLRAAGVQPAPRAGREAHVVATH